MISTLGDVEWEHVDRLLLAGYEEWEAAALAFLALRRESIAPYSELGVALALRPRFVIPRPS